MKIEAYAKVNFTLEVFGKRADGFHALRSLVAPVSLSDTLEIEEAEDISSDTGYADDLCVRAARALRAASGSRGGARIRVEKRIPAGGGLGGGSADAAAVLVALDSLWNLGLGPGRLAQIGADVGSDVPALVLSRFCGLVVMEGRGECVRPAGLERFPRVDLVFANPGVPSPTGEVYAKCKPRVAQNENLLYNMISALGAGDADAIARAMANDLEEPAVSLHPEIEKAKRSLEACGVRRAMVSGSGSTVFGPVPDGPAGLEIAARLRGMGFKAWTAHCPVV